MKLPGNSTLAPASLLPASNTTHRSRQSLAKQFDSAVNGRLSLFTFHLSPLRTAFLAALALTLACAVTVRANEVDLSSGKVKVGVFHSLSGTMAISETSLRDILLFAF